MSFLVRGAVPVDTSGAAAYDALAADAAALVLRRYSTSFGLACRLLAEPVRGRVRAIYAMVRVADEIVDAPRPGSSVADRRRVLDALQAEVHDAVRTGHSSNLVVHAYALAARECGIGEELTTPFFASMATDLDRADHDPASFATYVYGSAEVVGLMCLRAFLADEPDPAGAYERLAPGAQALGAAFQKVNFLRDLDEDSSGLGRRYFPGVEPSRLDDRQRDLLLDDIDADLATAAAVVPLLPVSSRAAVEVASGLFAELSRRLRATPAAELRRRRVRVPGPVKARIAARVVLGSRR